MSILEDAYGWDMLIKTISLLVGICNLIAWCKLFSKANMGWYKMLIPIYRNFCQYKLVGLEVVFVVELLLGIVLVIFQASSLIVSLVSLPFHILFCLWLAKAFGKGWGFGIGLIVLHPVFLMILAFGGAEYDEKVAQFQTAHSNEPWTCACGTLNKASRGKCTSCGAEKPSTPIWVCACGHMNTAGYAHCTRCGADRF